VTVLWSRRAEADLDAIFDFIRRDSPVNALAMIDRITRRAAQIAQFPYSGRMVPEVSNSKIRELIEGPYRIVFEVRDGQVAVLAVVHSARDFDWESLPLT